MLILTRRPTEVINIGDTITVTVLSVVGNQVRIGIQAPKNIVIDREEITERKRKQDKGSVVHKANPQKWPKGV